MSMISEELIACLFFYVLARIPPDPTIFEQRCVASQGCLLLLYLKQHLKEMYGFSDRLEFPVNYFSWLSRFTDIKFKIIQLYMS